MNGYSDFVRDILIRYYSNYLQGSAPAVPYSGGSRWVRLSRDPCASNGAGWVELDDSVFQNPGYAPVELTNPVWVDHPSLTTEKGYYWSYLNDDVIFAPATDPWNQRINQVGIWGHPTSTAADQFILGFELPNLQINYGESLTFKNESELVNGITTKHVTPVIQHMNGIAAQLEKADSGASSYVKIGTGGILNAGTATFPTLTSASVGLPITIMYVSLKEASHIDWLSLHPAIASAQGWNVKLNLNGADFEYVTYLGDTWLTNKTAHQFTPSSGTANIYTIGATMYTNDSFSGGTIPAFGGAVDNAPVVVLDGETPVIEANGIMVGYKASDPT